MLSLFLIGCVLFMLRRRIDSYAIAGMGMVIYYFPIFFDQLWYMDSAAKFTDMGKPADLDLQAGVLVVFYTLLMFSFVPSLFPVVKKVYGVNDKVTSQLMILATLILSFYIVPMAISYSGKTARVASIGIASVFFEYLFSLSTLSFLYWSAYAKNKLVKLLSLCGVLYLSCISIFIFQERSAIFFSMLGFLLYFFYGKKISISSVKFRYCVFFVMVTFVLMGKHLANYFFYGTEYESWVLVLKDSLESYGISSNLNYVYESGLDYFYLGGIFKNIIPFMASADTAHVDYHELIKSNVFPDVTYGMGRNPIGELWVNLKWYGIVVYCAILCFKCSLFDFFIKRTVGLLRIFLMLLLLFSVFYFNRNSLQNDIAFHRNYLIFFFSFVFLASVFTGGYMFKSYVFPWSNRH